MRYERLQGFLAYTVEICDHTPLHVRIFFDPTTHVRYEPVRQVPTRCINPPPQRKIGQFFPNLGWETVLEHCLDGCGFRRRCAGSGKQHYWLILYNRPIFPDHIVDGDFPRVDITAEHQNIKLGQVGLRKVLDRYQLAAYLRVQLFGILLRAAISAMITQQKFHILPFFAYCHKTLATSKYQSIQNNPAAARSR